MTMENLKNALEYAQNYIEEHGTYEGSTYAFGYLECAVKHFLEENEKNDK